LHPAPDTSKGTCILLKKSSFSLAFKSKPPKIGSLRGCGCGCTDSHREGRGPPKGGRTYTCPEFTGLGMASETCTVLHLVCVYCRKIRGSQNTELLNWERRRVGQWSHQASVMQAQVYCYFVVPQSILPESLPCLAPLTQLHKGNWLINHQSRRRWLRTGEDEVLGVESNPEALEHILKGGALPPPPNTIFNTDTETTLLTLSTQLLSFLE
jgi:hypothetical protein